MMRDLLELAVAMVVGVITIVGLVSIAFLLQGG